MARKMNILGVIPAYNEEDCVGVAVRALLRMCNHVIVFNHGSADDTKTIALDAGAHEIRYLDRKEFPARREDGVQSFALWRHIALEIRRSGYDWVVWSDADDFMRKPDGALPAHEDIEAVAAQGYQVIRPLLRFFHRTRQDIPDKSYLRRMRYYSLHPDFHSPRAWQVPLTPLDPPAGMHIQDPAIQPKKCPHYLFWPEGTKVLNNKWLLDCYPFRSQEQAIRKVAARDWIMPIPGKRRRYISNAAHPRCAASLKRETRELEMP